MKQVYVVANVWNDRCEHCDYDQIVAVFESIEDARAYMDQLGMAYAEAMENVESIVEAEFTEEYIEKYGKEFLAHVTINNKGLLKPAAEFYKASNHLYVDEQNGLLLKVHTTHINPNWLDQTESDSAQTLQ